MSPTPNPVVIGVCGDGSIITAQARDAFLATKRVTLSTSFTYRVTLFSDGWPSPPPAGGKVASPLTAPLASGATVLLWDVEAAALIAAGKAVAA